MIGFYRIIETGAEQKMSYYIEISPETKKFQLNLKELWRYRYLVWLLTRKAFALSYKQTILGPLWLLIEIGRAHV